LHVCLSHSIAYCRYLQSLCLLFHDGNVIWGQACENTNLHAGCLLYIQRGAPAMRDCISNTDGALGDRQTRHLHYHKWRLHVRSTRGRDFDNSAIRVWDMSPPNLSSALKQHNKPVVEGQPAESTYVSLSFPILSCLRLWSNMNLLAVEFPYSSNSFPHL
jgi:hypothetical protein